MAHELVNIKYLQKLGISVLEIKQFVAKRSSAIFPREDGSEYIPGDVFEDICLEWARSLRNGIRPKPPKLKVMSRGLYLDDIHRYKHGKSAGLPNITVEGLLVTLQRFFNKVDLSHISLQEAVAMFDAEECDRGRELRRVFYAAYRRYFGIKRQSLDVNLTQAIGLFYAVVNSH